MTGSSATWDPHRYLRFADHRARPGLELLARIPDVAAQSIVDLGCGTGNLTAAIADRWPAAEVVGIDSSPEMIAMARADHPSVAFEVADIGTWRPAGPIDVVYSNATLHWLDDHATLFPELRSWLRPGGVLAVQMPDNWREPTHRIPADILDRGDWPPDAIGALMRDRLGAPEDYAAWVAPAIVDMWRTTYYQRLEGEDPVWTWVTGSVLRPVLAALDDDEAARFASACRQAYRHAYPMGLDGRTTLPFSRLFIVAIAT
jgi:trans-aconitate 2-methyltransferase